MKLYNLGLFGVTYTKQQIHLENGIKIKHKFQVLSKKAFNRLRIFLSW